MGNRIVTKFMKYFPVLEHFFLRYFFWMWTIFKIFIEFVTILFLFYVLDFWARGMWDLSSLDQGSNLHPLHWKVKSFFFFFNLISFTSVFFKILFIYLFIYLWLRWVFIAACGFSPVAAIEATLLQLRCASFSLWWLLFVAEHGL